MWKTLRKITEMLFNINIHKVTNIDTSIQPTSSVKDLNWERVKQLTSPTTPYEAFTVSISVVVYTLRTVYNYTMLVLWCTLYTTTDTI